MINDLKSRLLLLATVLLAPTSVQAAGIQSQTSFQNLSDIPKQIFDVLINFLPAVATIYLAIAGYRYITSQGNPEQIEKAKKNLTYAVVGVIVAYSAFLIIRLVGNQLGFGLSL